MMSSTCIAAVDTTNVDVRLNSQLAWALLIVAFIALVVLGPKINRP